MTSLSDTQRARLERGTHLSWVHWAVIALSLVLTVSAWHFSRMQVRDKAEQRFEREASQVLDLVQDRMHKYEDALWGGVALFHASQQGGVNYDEWVAYSESVRIDERYPGINGIGVINAIGPDEVEAFLAEQRERRPAFEIHPAHGEDEFWPITYIEPVEANRAAVGLDMAHEANRFDAAKKARDTGAAQITGPIVLVQDAQQTPGFLFFAPFYEGVAHPEPVDRVETIRGLVYAPFVVKRLMQGVLHKENRHVGVRLTDGSSIIYDELVATESDYDPSPQYTKAEAVSFYGRTWTFEIASGVSFDAASANSQPFFILVAGLMIEGLLVWLFLFHARASRHALAFADLVSTDLKRTQAEAVAGASRAESNEREIRTLLDAMPAYIYYKDGNNTILDMNQTAADAMGMPIEAVRGHKTEEFFPAKNAAEFLVADRAVLASGEPELGIEEVHEGGNGDRRIIRTDKIPLANEHGAYDRILAIATDITELREAQDRFDRAVTGSADGLWDYNPATGDVWYSDRFKDLVGYAPEEYGLLAHRLESWLSLLHPEDKEGNLQAIEAHLSSDAPYDHQFRMRMRTGQYRWFRARGQALRSEDGTGVQMSGSITDISVLREAHEELTRKNVELERFVYSASHDLKAPLLTIIGYAELGVGDAGKVAADELRDYFRRVARAGNKLNETVDDLLELSRLGRAHHEPEEIALDGLLDDIIAALEQGLNEKHVCIERSLEHPSVYADRVRIGQIMQNLVANAIRYGCSAAGPVIEIGSRLEGEYVHLFVRDNGDGIAPKHHDRIFELFNRLSAEEGGTGVGLAIVRQVAESLGGRAWVESEEGQGATFWVSLGHTSTQPETASACEQADIEEIA
ncbi:MAG: hypothetical protein DHS20C14_00480 [Phycisphaeraceae bacterium]|nr:MAG: hypothetical protein DHS20C14_00480 [Phycisphaeraceae bacterium]